MENVEHAEDMLAAAMLDSDGIEGEFHEAILEVLRGRREQVESLRRDLKGAVTALEDFIAEVAAPTGRLRLAEHTEGDTLLGIVERGRASLAALRGQ